MFREERLRSKLHVWTSRAESAWPIYDPDYRRRRLQAACKAASNHAGATRDFPDFDAHKDEVTDIAWSVMTRSTVSGCPLSMIVTVALRQAPPRLRLHGCDRALLVWITSIWLMRGVGGR